VTKRQAKIGAPMEVAPPSQGVSGALVVGLSARRASEIALDRAVVLGERLRCTMHVVHVLALEDFSVDPDSYRWDEEAKATVERLHEVTRRALDGYRFGWSYRVLHAEPGEGIAAFARTVQPDFVVLGARDVGWKGALERLTVPSVSRHLINEGLSVLVVSHDGEEASVMPDGATG